MQNTVDHLIVLQNFLDSHTVFWFRSFLDIEMQWLFKSILFKMHVSYVYHIHNKTWLPDEIIWLINWWEKVQLQLIQVYNSFRIMFSSNDNY